MLPHLDLFEGWALTALKSTADPSEPGCRLRAGQDVSLQEPKAHISHICLTLGFTLPQPPASESELLPSPSTQSALLRGPFARAAGPFLGTVCSWEQLLTGSVLEKQLGIECAREGGGSRIRRGGREPGAAPLAPATSTVEAEEPAAGSGDAGQAGTRRICGVSLISLSSTSHCSVTVGTVITVSLESIAAGTVWDMSPRMLAHQGPASKHPDGWLPQDFAGGCVPGCWSFQYLGNREMLLMDHDLVTSPCGLSLPPRGAQHHHHPAHHKHPIHHDLKHNVSSRVCHPHTPELPVCADVFGCGPLGHPRPSFLASFLSRFSFR